MTSMQEPSLVIDLHYPADACLYAYSEVDPQAIADSFAEQRRGNLTLNILKVFYQLGPHHTTPPPSSDLQ